VFTRSELALIADLAISNDLIVVDRRGVRAPQVFDGAEHVPLASPRRHARAHPRDLERRQDVQHHRLEDRLVCGPRDL